MSPPMSQQTLQIEAVVLAAGRGTRMRSNLHKVLHPVAGKPMLHWVLDRAAELGAKRTHVVVGHQAETVKAATPHAVEWVLQEEQLGTGHAVLQALPGVDDDSIVLVLYGDVPMASFELLDECTRAAADGSVALVTADFQDPAQLGRIVRAEQPDGNGDILSIVEFADATDAEKAICEINSGIMAVGAKRLRHMLTELSKVPPENNNGEYYLTTVIEDAVRDGITVRGIRAAREEEVTGVNDRIQLAQLERAVQRQLAEGLMRDGVTLADPARLDIRGAVSVGSDSFIDANVVLEGEVSLGASVQVGSGCVIRDSRIGDGVTVHPNTLIDGADIAANASVGPFARIRPGTQLAEGVKIGNFVETKKTTMGKDSKASHLTYLGDATVGADCNIGAGTVTCNYDGVNKHRTDIGDDVFVGTNSTLVAPISLGNGSFVAAGSTLTSDLGEQDLGVGRGKQRNIKGWTRPDRRRK